MLNKRTTYINKYIKIIIIITTKKINKITVTKTVTNRVISITKTKIYITENYIKNIFVLLQLLLSVKNTTLNSAK